MAWTLTNAIKSSADIYRAPWDVPWPPAIGNIGEAWSRGQLGVALANSVYVTAMTVAVVLALSVSAAYSLTRLRPPARAVLFLLVLAPLIIPTEVLIVPLFSIFRTLGLHQQPARARAVQRGRRTSRSRRSSWRATSARSPGMSSMPPGSTAPAGSTSCSGS